MRRQLVRHLFGRFFDTESLSPQGVIIYQGRIMAADSVERLRDLMNAPSLEEIFSQLVEQRDLESVARDIVSAIA